VRFYLDEHLSGRIAAAARKADVDAVAADELHLLGISDRAHLLIAAREGRCLVTQDRRDFLRLTTEFMQEGRPHAGILLVPASVVLDRFGPIARALIAYAQAHPEGLPRYGIDFLQVR
jgi:predicted nuclease of predicted toxin-antitoxin system